MHIKITWPYIAAFIALNMIMGELHEQAHISTGYLICGCYGSRDFNVWSTCDHCAHPSMAFLATLAGPLFSCTLMWLGAIMFCKSDDTIKQSFGFSLLFANLPFARIFTALTGGGDEKVVIRFLLGENSALLISKIIASLLVILVCAPPVIMVVKKLTNKNHIMIVIGFLVIPLIYGMFYQHMFLNMLFQHGIGSTTKILGTPNIVLFHLGMMLLIFLLMHRKLDLSMNKFVNV